MLYYYPTRYSPFWITVTKMIDELYAEKDKEDVCILSVYLNHNIDQFREKHPNQKLIIYQLEPLCATGHWWSSEQIIKQLKKVDEVWDYDYQNVLYLKLHGINAKFKPFLYSQSNDNITPKPKDIDVLFFGTSTSRRYEWLYNLNFYLRQNTRSMILANVFHPEIDEYIARSKIIINIHNSNGVSQQEQPRISHLLTNGKHVVSEKSEINYYGNLVKEVSDFKEMVLTIHDMLDSYSDNNEYAIKDGFKKLTLDIISDNAKKYLHEKISL